MYIYDRTSMNSSENEKCFRQSCRENQNTLLCSIFFFSKIVPFMRICEKYSTAGQAIDDNTEHAHWMLYEYKKGYKKTQNM